MQNQDLKDVLERVEGWPESQQRQAARVLLDLELQGSGPRLTSDQAAEVEARRARPDRKFVSLAEARNHFTFKKA